MADLFKLLPHFTWRGNVYPVSGRDVSFSHEGARHKLQYRDGEIIEQTGHQALTFSYTIPMRDGVAKGPYKQLFSQSLPVLFADIQNRVVDTLTDPVYGTFQCVPTSFRDTLDVNKRDGVDISIEFVRTLTSDELDTTPEVTSLQGLGAEQRNLDDELKLVPGFEQFISKKGKTDFLSAIGGALAQIKGNADKVNAGLLNLSAKMQKVETQVTKLENPQLWGLQSSARSVRDSALKLKAHGDDPANRIVTVTQNYNKTIAAVAQEAGMTVIDLLKLNPGLAKSPLVAKGTRIRKRG